MNNPAYLPDPLPNNYVSSTGSAEEIDHGEVLASMLHGDEYDVTYNPEGFERIIREITWMSLYMIQRMDSSELKTYLILMGKTRNRNGYPEVLYNGAGVSVDDQMFQRAMRNAIDRRREAGLL